MCLIDSKRRTDCSTVSVVISVRSSLRRPDGVGRVARQQLLLNRASECGFKDDVDVAPCRRCERLAVFADAPRCMPPEFSLDRAFEVGRLRPEGLDSNGRSRYIARAPWERPLIGQYRAKFQPLPYSHPSRIDMLFGVAGAEETS